MKAVCWNYPLCWAEVAGRIAYIICGAQYRMKMWSPLCKTYEGFQDGGSRILNQEEALRRTGPCEYSRNQPWLQVTICLWRSCVI